MSLNRQLPAAVGAAAAAFAVDVALLHALVEYARWHYLAAASASFLAGTVVIYLLSLRFVFSYRRLESGAVEFTLFGLVGLGGLVVNAAVMYSVVELAGQHYLAAKFAAGGATFFFNFMVRRALLFTPVTPPRRMEGV